MSRLGRLRAETRAASLSFLRRRTAVFFTFFFPVIIVVIFGVLVQTQPGGGGLFTEEPAFYAPGYLAVVVLFTPLSRVGSEVARHRDGNRFEKLATTPLSRTEWLLAQTVVNVVIIGIAGLLILGLMVWLTGAVIRPSVLLVPFVVLGVALFCAVGAMLGSLADSQDGVIAASNGLALPLLFLSETFVPQSLLPAWLPTWLSPLTYFSRGVRAATTGAGDAVTPLVILTACAVVGFAVGARLLPRTD
ncbi:ABC transporter permease [Haloarcula salina]|uniref:ABC transporter permease n=1 Tax=Haloarcula salina TaxID=1429914 RepID=A0AA41KGS2_9EURY|nr:ABC transporter permease [Haloarcula salina]MBV0900971.1 ABC transporter permease [Haloarcula salina]